MELVISQTKQELGRSAAEQGAECIREAIRTRGSASILVATGASQFELLENLVAAEGIHWPAVTVFHLDEYVGMPITHPASFRRFLWERFVRLLPLPLHECHYINGELDPQRECLRIGNLIKSHTIDVAFVGIGENCHMAFNDPPADFETQTPYLVLNLDQQCRQQQVGEGWFKSLNDVPLQAISISIHQILTSRTIIVSVPDKRKAQAVKDAVERPLSSQYPSTCLQRHSRAFVYIDPDSASMLSDIAAA